MEAPTDDRPAKDDGSAEVDLPEKADRSTRDDASREDGEPDQDASSRGEGVDVA